MITINDQLDDAISINDLVTAVRAIGDQSLIANDAVKQMISDLNYKVVQPAIKEANQTAKQADKLVEQSKVHDDAIKAQDEALTEAKQGANDAMIRANSAWDVATSATKAASSAQSDAKQATSSVAALLTSVDTLKGTVTGLQAESTMQASKIQNKVTRSDVTGMLTGYATQEYTQSLVTQKADEWNLNLIKLKNDTQTSVTNLSATVDGLQSTVKSKADSSTVTQLKNDLQSKVESSAYTSAINQLSDDINLRVKSDELLSQINLEAGRTLIDSKKIVLNADSVIFSDNSKAFIPDAAISSLTVDKLTSGTIDTNKLRISNGSANMVFDNRGIGIDSDGFISRQGSQSYDFYQGNNSNWTYRIANGKAKYTSQAKVSGLNFFSNQGIGSSIIVGSANFDATKNPKFSISDYGVTVAPSLFFQNADQSKTTWMGFTRNTEEEGLLFHSGNDEGEMFQVASGARFQKYLYINGYARAQGWLNNSELSKKTNVQPLDGSKALDLIRQDDMYTYEYIQNLEAGISDPQASFIIDDVNQVSQYRVPREFIDNTGHYREMGVELSYLIAAFQELDRQVQDLRKKETN